jgi:FkbM family methyltransferase
MDYKELIEGLYESLLQRRPDGAGIDDKVGRLNSGVATPKDIIDEIISSEEFKSKIPMFLAGLGQDYRFFNSQSQYNEIELVLSHAISGTFASKVVVDVGARGRDRSNSYDLLKFFKWRGILIEANPRLIPRIRKDFKGLDAEVIECAVSDYQGTARFTIGSNDDVSSLNAQAASAWGETKGELNVNVERLAAILQSKNVPPNFGLLSIDIEGEDIKVLNDLINNSDYRPRYVIIEASYDFAVRSLDDLPFSEKVKNTYRIIDQTTANLILHVTDSR